MIQWFKDKWNAFEAWVAAKVPGWKVKLVAAAGGISSAALMVQQYISGLPLEQIVTAKTLVITNAVLFTLIFWLRNISNRAGG